MVKISNGRRLNARSSPIFETAYPETVGRRGGGDGGTSRVSLGLGPSGLTTYRP